MKCCSILNSRPYSIIKFNYIFLMLLFFLLLFIIFVHFLSLTNRILHFIQFNVFVKLHMHSSYLVENLCKCTSERRALAFCIATYRENLWLTRNYIKKRVPHMFKLLLLFALLCYHYHCTHHPQIEGISVMSKHLAEERK